MDKNTTVEIKAMYRKLDALDKKNKPLIIDWLCGLFGYENYPHSFKDQWINWSVWDNDLSISFDTRQPEQVKLLSMIHPCFLGTPQYRTLKIVNEKTFYLSVDKIGDLKYPKITTHKLLNKDKHTDNDGDTFYTYDWEVFLDDNSSIHYHNQNHIMDMKYRDFIYDATLQERFFTEFLSAIEKH